MWMTSLPNLTNVGQEIWKNVVGNSTTLSSREKKHDRHRTDFRETHACSMPFVVKESYTKFHENPTNGLVAKVHRGQIGAWKHVFSIYGVHLLLCKEPLK
jgi:hypothetical protein